MPKKIALPPADLDEAVIVIEDAADLTAKELEQERKAYAEEVRKRSWMTHSAEELAGRIPVSVFAMGSLPDAA
jgi:Tfp pilus assembly protein PilN